ncbi:serine hydrolase domain-containing protein [Aegicerativicinus sediminis]|uniref:serine hydrolase domain-containing protein n=1 Tax=Aegicerativicinus sediminis TaxID=2893202 RepID=UPI001E57EB3F|nr:serine hydrolase domain-containing protein [Aegicerativicinus sediminis]
MKNFLFSFCLILLASSISNSQTKSLQTSPPLEEATPSSVGMSSERLGLIDNMCKEEIENGNLPGIVALVARKGKIVFWKAYGNANNQINKGLKRDDIFRIASQTKAITSTAVMMLWEQGKFQLDDPISKYIPEFKDPQVLKSFNEKDSTYTTEPAKSEITIRQLLSHTSGIGYGIIDSDERFRKIYQKAGIVDLYSDKDVTIEDNIKKLAKLPLHANPGEKWIYSEGLDVLGYFIEVMSGMKFDQFLKSHIFDPLGMKDTYFYIPDEKTKRLVEVQSKQDGQWRIFPNTFYNTHYPIEGAKTFFSGGAGLTSTAKDYATFLQMYLNGGEYNGIRLLSRTTVNAILSNQIGDLWGEKGDSAFGLAFNLVTEFGEAKGGKGSLNTFSWGGYFNTQYFADPEEEIIGVILKQTQGQVNDVTGWKFPILIYQSIDD